MSDSNEIVAALIGAITGGAAGYLATWTKESLTRDSIFKGLQGFETNPHHNIARARIYNTSNYAMTDCWAYITIDYDSRDISEWQPEYEAHISPSNPRDLKEDRLCWAVLANSVNPPKVDIYSQEQQELLVFSFDPERSLIGIFSEEGLPTKATKIDKGDVKPKKFRVVLRGDKKYRGYLKIVSKEAKGKSFDLEIDLTNGERPLTIYGHGDSRREWSCFSERCRFKCLG